MFKNFKTNKKESGIALLFTVMLSSILLVVALSIVDIASQQAIFSTSARHTNDALFAADTGIECALFNDKSNISFNPITGNNSFVTCLGGLISASFDSANAPIYSWEFDLPNLGSSGNGCAKVFVEKTELVPGSYSTKIISRGYNTGTSGPPSNLSCTSTTYSVERLLEASYTDL